MPASAVQTKRWFRPKGWFTTREIGIVVNRILRDDPSKGDMHNRQPVTPRRLWHALKDYDMYPVSISSVSFKISIDVLEAIYNWLNCVYSTVWFLSLMMFLLRYLGLRRIRISHSRLSHLGSARYVYSTSKYPEPKLIKEQQSSTRCSCKSPQTSSTSFYSSSSPV